MAIAIKDNACFIQFQVKINFFFDKFVLLSFNFDNKMISLEPA